MTFSDALNRVASWISHAILWIPILSAFAAGALIGLVVPATARRGPAAIGLLWLATTVTLGYLWYRGVCSQPLTCDEGGVRYWLSLVPRYSIVWGIVFAAAVLIVRWRVPEIPSPSSSGRALSLAALLGGVGAIVGFSLAALLLAGYDHARCYFRPLRREDGTIGAQCEIE